MNEHSSKDRTSQKKKVEVVSAIESNAPSHDIRLQRLNVAAGTRELIRDGEVVFPTGKITLVVGPSGVGKSILLRIIAGLIPKDHPSIHYSGDVNVSSESGLQQKLGVVFQSFALFDELSPVANVEFAKAHRSEASRDVPALELLKTLKVPTDVKTSLLSGGQRQRLAIARTLAYDPPAILYDEPTSGLDPATAVQVAGIIKETQVKYQKTSIVVTHDYESLLPIADKLIVLDPIEKTLSEIPKEEWSRIGDRLQPMAQSVNLTVDELAGEHEAWRIAKKIGTVIPFASRAVEALLIGLFSLIPTWSSIKWGARYLLHYARLVAGPTAWFYVAMAGIIIGFVTTYFIFRFLPFSGYTQPLLVEELLAAMGFALYRIFIPVLATVMIAARSGAAVTADIGSKQYGNQIDAMQTIGASPRRYLLTPIMLSFFFGTPLLTLISFWAARMTSLLTFCFTQPGHTPDFWYQNFHYTLHVIGDPFYFGTGWLLAKLVCCGIGIGVISYFQGRQPKHSSTDVSRSVTVSILWTTLFVLCVHFAFAFYEFQVLPNANS